MLQSTDSVVSAKILIRNVINMWEEGGFNLTKFVARHCEILEDVPQEKISPTMKERKIDEVELSERAFGIVWRIENDRLGFRITIQDFPMTRRGVLATISSIFDPLGIASPFVLKGRKILQQITSD